MTTRAAIRYIKWLVVFLFMGLVTTSGYVFYLDYKYPWADRIRPSGIVIPRGVEIINKVERSAVFGSTYSYLLRLPSDHSSCRALGMGVHEGKLNEVMDDAKEQFWRDLGGEKKGLDLCYRYFQSPGKIIVAWAHGDRMLLDIELQ